MRIDEIPVGASIEIEVHYNGRSISFNSEILFLHDNLFYISPVTVNDRTVGFNDKCLINLIVKTSGKVFLWENVEIKLVKYNGNIYHQISLQGEGKPYNRRETYRMYIGEDMPVYINTASGPHLIEVLVKDISESGVGFITKEALDLNRIILLKIKDIDTILLSGVIVRKEYLPHLDSYLYGCKFNEKNDKLGKFIAKKQGEHLRKKISSYSSPLVSKKSKQRK